MVEPTLTEDVSSSKYEPPVEIDKVDALRIGLRELRSRLGIIPQNPVLFSGTIRSNIDPFDDYTDAQIWEALSNCGMKEEVEAMPGHLGAAVAEYGENLSAGQRQMLVLGRALLKQCRILLLDEATSSVDYETDRVIQRTIREAFPGCTVLTIAHRINTIMDSDKILVMKDGLVEEFAPPGELLRNENSLFSEIVRHAKTQQH
jgi:ABC-type multidrug transport system fused ATPase/permease subunit